MSKHLSPRDEELIHMLIVQPTLAKPKPQRCGPLHFTSSGKRFSPRTLARARPSGVVRPC